MQTQQYEWLLQVILIRTPEIPQNYKNIHNSSSDLNTAQCNIYFTEKVIDGQETDVTVAIYRANILHHYTDYIYLIYVTDNLMLGLFCCGNFTCHLSQDLLLISKIHNTSVPIIKAISKTVSGAAKQPNNITVIDYINIT